MSLQKHELVVDPNCESTSLSSVTAAESPLELQEGQRSSSPLSSVDQPEMSSAPQASRCDGAASCTAASAPSLRGFLSLSSNQVEQSDGAATATSSGILELATTLLQGDGPPSRENLQSPSSNKKILRWKDLPTSSNVRNDGLEAHSKALECRMDRISLSDSLRKSFDITLRQDNDMYVPAATPCDVCSSNDKLLESSNDKSLTTEAPTTLEHDAPSSQLERMKHDIKKAARLELQYLNSVKELREQRHLLQQASDSLLNSIRHGSLSKATEEILQAEVAKVQAELEKAAAMERKYTQKSKKIHDKRYRWLQVYKLMERGDDNTDTLSHVNEDHGVTMDEDLPPLLPAELEDST